LQEFKLYPGAKEAILHLTEIYNLYVVTSRQKCEKTHIENILRHNEILHCFNEIHCVWDWQDGHFVSEPKKVFVEKKRSEETIIGFIDDSIDEVRWIISTKNIASPALFDPKRTYPKEAIGFEIFHDWKTIEKIFS
jgi:5'(3')-deoxyribonucleotidase